MNNKLHNLCMWSIDAHNIGSSRDCGGNDACDCVKQYSGQGIGKNVKQKEWLIQTIPFYFIFLIQGFD